MAQKLAEEVEKNRKLWKCDMAGKWWAAEDCSDKSQAGVVYMFRIQLAEGLAGDALWLGTEEDRPFLDSYDHPLNIDILAEDAKLPAARRGAWCKRGTRKVVNVHQLYTSTVEGVKVEHQGRKDGYVGDEIPVAGQFQWLKDVSSSTDKQWLSVNDFNLEFVTGVYSPSSRRLTVAGTHKNAGSKNETGTGIYDMVLSEDGKTMTGLSTAYDPTWECHVSGETFADGKVVLKNSKGEEFIFDDVAEKRKKDREQREKFAKAQAALGNIRDQKARDLMKTYHADMVECVLKNLENEMNSCNEKLKEISSEQSTRLGKIMMACMEKYELVEERYKLLTNIKDKDGTHPLQLPAPPIAKDVPSQVRALLAVAAMKEKRFRDEISAIVRDVNKAANKEEKDFGMKELREKYNIDTTIEMAFPLDDLEENMRIISPEDMKPHACVGRFGCPKSFDRALAKVSAGKVLRDLNRATLLFEDPYALAVTFHVLNSKFKVTEIENKFNRKPYKQPPCLSLNLDVEGIGWISEVQLMLQDILEVKKEMHRLYEVLRAKSPLEIMKPLFKIKHGSDNFS